MQKFHATNRSEPSVRTPRSRAPDRTMSRVEYDGSERRSTQTSTRQKFRPGPHGEAARTLRPILTYFFVEKVQITILYYKQSLDNPLNKITVYLTLLVLQSGALFTF